MNFCESFKGKREEKRTEFFGMITLVTYME